MTHNNLCFFSSSSIAEVLLCILDFLIQLKIYVREFFPLLKAKQDARCWINNKKDKQAEEYRIRETVTMLRRSYMAESTFQCSFIILNTAAIMDEGFP